MNNGTECALGTKDALPLRAATFGGTSVQPGQEEGQRESRGGEDISLPVFLSSLHRLAWEQP